MGQACNEQNVDVLNPQSECEQVVQLKMPNGLKEQIEKFSASMKLSVENAINKLVELELEWIEADVDYGGFYELAEMLGVLDHYGDNGEEKDSLENDDNYSKASVLIDGVNSHAMRELCKIVGWNPEAFIVRAIKHRLKVIEQCIENQEFEFIADFYDLSDLVTALDRLRCKKRRENDGAMNGGNETATIK
jgi:hypothetical protein